MADVDVFIADGSFTDAESPAKREWAIGTFTSSIVSAELVGAKVLFCTYHQPIRSDTTFEQAFQAEALTNHSFTAGTDIRLAREGESYEF